MTEVDMQVVVGYFLICMGFINLIFPQVFLAQQERLARWNRWIGAGWVNAIYSSKAGPAVVRGLGLLTIGAGYVFISVTS